jgi:hypothetical protein
VIFEHGIKISYEISDEIEAELFENLRKLKINLARAIDGYEKRIYELLFNEFGGENINSLEIIINTSLKNMKYLGGIQ